MGANLLDKRMDDRAAPSGVLAAHKHPVLVAGLGRQDRVPGASPWIEVSGPAVIDWIAKREAVRHPDPVNEPANARPWRGVTTPCVSKHVGLRGPRLSESPFMIQSIRMTLATLVGSSLAVAAQVSPSAKVAESPEIQQLIAKLPARSSHDLDVAYVSGAQPGSKPDSVQTLDLYVPPGKGPFPLVFWIHGGGWHSGSKLESGIHLALRFVPKGFALASVNYRLSADAPFPAQIEDCNAALAHLRHRAEAYRIDPDRVGVVGHSAGAHLAALMACTGNSQRFGSDPKASLRVQAAVCWATPADLDRDRGKWPTTSMMHSAEDAPLWAFFPNRRYEGEFARMASPASHVHPDMPPMAFVHGQKDELVPPGQALAFVDLLKRAGVRVKLRVDPNRGHNVMNAESVSEAVGFLTSTLKANDG